jgi:sugar phosphate permease
MNHRFNDIPLSERMANGAVMETRSKSFSGFLGAFRPAPPIPVTLSDPKEIEARYRSWQTRVLIFSILGYATFYFVRGNLPVALPFIGNELGITKAQLGLFLTLHGVVYGISKFLNGFLADRANAAVFMSTALLASALINVCFGFGSGVLVLGLFWVLNGWFQGMGFPPCARLTSNWFSPKELAAKFSIWNLSHNIGSIGVVLLCGFLVSGTLFAANWRLCFFVPAAIAAVIAMVLWWLLPETPESVGLPEHEGTRVEESGNGAPEDFGAFVRRQVFGNPFIWIFSAANFFVYTIRYAVFNWGPTMLMETRHMQITHAAAIMAVFEAFGGLGALLGGWITDRFLGGRAGRACILYMALAGVSLLLLWKVQTQSELLIMIFLGATGFFVYGPQCLLAIACMKLATKRAAATAVGLTSLFGYASTTVSGWGLGLLVQTYGWNAGFAMLVACAATGTLLFIVAWPAKAHGYKDQEH